MIHAISHLRGNSITLVPELQRHIHIATLAFNVVGIQSFRILTFQDAALAARLAIVQALPGIEHIRPASFLGRLFN